MFTMLYKQKDQEIVNFLIDDKGIEILKHLFELQGKHGKFNNETVENLFNILHIQMNLIGIKGFMIVISILIERIVFNIKIWGSSDYSVQVIFAIFSFYNRNY